MDYIVLFLLWIIFLYTLRIAVPRDRLREAIAAFLFFHMLTWIFGIGLTYAGLLDAPIRLFKEATQISFTMEYLVFPTFAVLFQLRFPVQVGFIRRMMHYLFWVGSILAFMIIIDIFSSIMTVTWDNLVRSFFNFTIELWLCRQYVLWLFHSPDIKRLDTYES
ncbi:hypothetical protein NC661_19360 [Aquibacillus koreensis]|uniref:Uncharacterized protein n=1 Tax=Aquibacillus koreensis TaxID=279446 RepID=A0A9X4ALJ7_9BACI|nr:CBO0543 family protein [Aquibacillus koreensis]MCT2535350.1 hypothetical protein [Aquibacillus koreensis]MDC3422515.1 hypothetical protein [Aquibacillus koreensis]